LKVQIAFAHPPPCGAALFCRADCRIVLSDGAAAAGVSAEVALEIEGDGSRPKPRNCSGIERLQSRWPKPWSSEARRSGNRSRYKGRDKAVELSRLTEDEALARIQKHPAHLHEHKTKGGDGIVELLLWTSDIKRGHVWMDVEHAEELEHDRFRLQRSPPR
jgi:hypothetical protein